MYKLSLKQNMKIMVDGKWRGYGEEWESSEPIDDPFINCTLINKSNAKDEKIEKRKDTIKEIKTDNEEEE